jgi:hypothetical protein
VSNLADRQSAPRVVRHSGELLAAIRDRIAELNTTHAAVENASGAQLGYISKCVGDDPPKRISLWLALLLLQTLGLEITLTPAPGFERFAYRLEPRKNARKEARKARKDLPPDFLRRRARLGGLARARLANLSDINRRANLTRWRRQRGGASSRLNALYQSDKSIGRETNEDTEQEKAD